MIRKRIISLVLAVLLTASLFVLSGCGNNEKMCNDLNADGNIVSAVMSQLHTDYIDIGGLEVTYVKVKETTDIDNGKVYCCDVTVSNDYISVTLDGDLVYSVDGDENETFSSCTYNASPESWVIKAVSGIKADTLTNADLPNADNLEYDSFTLGNVDFDEKAQKCSVEIYLSVQQDYVMATGIVLVNFTFADGKWSRTGFSTGDNFSMSWNIGGLWEGDEYKWSPASDMRLKYEFDIKSIDAQGQVDAVVYSHIYTGKAQHQVNDFEVTGKIDFTSMTLEIKFDEHKLLTATIKNGEFEGSIIDSNDGFSYYSGPFKRK